MSSYPNPKERNVNAGSRVLRFDQFEIDLEAGELRKAGTRIHLQAQPVQLLILLLQNPGKLVTREEIRHELWPADTFVDFDRSLATAVNKIRDALGDSAENPKFIETLPKRGYRFVGKVESETPLEFPGPGDEGSARAKRLTTEKIDRVTIVSSPRASTWSGFTAWILVGIFATAAAALFWGNRERSKEPVAWTVRPFTSYPGIQDSPSFSPDGSRISFIWDANGNSNAQHGHGFDLYVKGLGGEEILRLTNHPSQWLSAAWSPNGTRIAFVRLAGPDTGLYVVSALGGREKKIRSTHTPYSIAAPISWSPDGDSIAYSDRVANEFGDRMFVASLNSGETRLFFHDPACKHESNLTFSHDGKKVAWMCVKRLDDVDLMTGDSAGKSRRVVAARIEKNVRDSMGPP